MSGVGMSGCRAIKKKNRLCAPSAKAPTGTNQGGYVKPGNTRTPDKSGVLVAFHSANPLRISQTILHGRNVDSNLLSQKIEFWYCVNSGKAQERRDYQQCRVSETARRYS